MNELIECRECRAGFTQALESSVVWSCSEHGLKALSIADVVKQLMEAEQKTQELETQLKNLAESAMRYDSAIQRIAGSTSAQEEWAKEGYSNPFFVEGDDLDALYLTWLQRARRVVEARAEMEGT